MSSNSSLFLSLDVRCGVSVSARVRTSNPDCCSALVYYSLNNLSTTKHATPQATSRTSIMAHCFNDKVVSNVLRIPELL